MAGCAVTVRTALAGHRASTSGSRRNGSNLETNGLRGEHLETVTDVKLMKPVLSEQPVVARTGASRSTAPTGPPPMFR